MPRLTNNTTLKRLNEYRVPRDLHKRSNQACFNWLMHFIKHQMGLRRDGLFAKPTLERIRRGIAEPPKEKIKRTTKQREIDHHVYKRLARNCAISKITYIDPYSKDPSIRTKENNDTLFNKFKKDLQNSGYSYTQIAEIAQKVQIIAIKVKEDETEYKKQKALLHKLGKLTINKRRGQDKRNCNERRRQYYRIAAVHTKHATWMPQERERGHNRSPTPRPLKLSNLPNQKHSQNKVNGKGSKNLHYTITPAHNTCGKWVPQEREWWHDRPPTPMPLNLTHQRMGREPTLSAQWWANPVMFKSASSPIFKSKSTLLKKLK